MTLEDMTAQVRKGGCIQELTNLYLWLSLFSGNKSEKGRAVGKEGMFIVSFCFYHSSSLVPHGYL